MQSIWLQRVRHQWSEGGHIYARSLHPAQLALIAHFPSNDFGQLFFPFSFKTTTNPSHTYSDLPDIHWSPDLSRPPCLLLRWRRGRHHLRKSVLFSTFCNFRDICACSSFSFILRSSYFLSSPFYICSSKFSAWSSSQVWGDSQGIFPTQGSNPRLLH